MRTRLIGAVLAAAALLCAGPSLADNYVVKDATGATQTMGSKAVGGVQYPQHTVVDSTGVDATDTTNHAVKMNCVVGCGSGTVTANAGTNLNTSALALEAGHLATIDSKTPSLGQATSASSRPVVLASDPDYRPVSGTITAADVATTTIAGQSSVTLVQGSPTANSFQTWALNGHASATLTVTGTFTGTLTFETAADGGTVYGPATAKILGSGLTSGSATAPGVFRIDVTGMTNIRVRASAFASGTATVKLAASSSPGLTQVLNPLRLADATGVQIGIPSNPLAAGSPVSPSTASTTAEACHVYKASAANVYTLSGYIGAAGWIMVFNATSAPADGAVAPVAWRNLSSAGDWSMAYGGAPFSAGVVVCASSTGPLSKTAYSTNTVFAGQVQ